MLKPSLSLVVLSALILSACSTTPSSNSSAESTPQTEEKLNIVTTFYPIYDLTRKVAGQEAQVENLVPPGIEPHDYEPSPRELQEIYEADILVYNGAGVDSWVDNLLPDLEKAQVKVLNMSQNIPLLNAEESHEHGEEDHVHKEEEHEGHEEGHDASQDDHGDKEVHAEDHSHEKEVEKHVETEHIEDEHAHDHGDSPFDPHFWLDPVIAQKQVETLQSTLSQIKPEAQAVFVANANAASAQLQALDQEYRQGLQTCRQTQAIVTHDAYRYLEARYNLELLPISGLSPEEEPSARTLANLAKLSQENKIKYVFFETLASPKLAQTLAQEIGATTLVLNPIEGLTAEEQARGEDYFSLMRQNLQNLRLAFECQ